MTHWTGPFPALFMKSALLNRPPENATDHLRRWNNSGIAVKCIR